MKSEGFGQLLFGLVILAFLFALLIGMEAQRNGRDEVCNNVASGFGLYGIMIDGECSVQDIHGTVTPLYEYVINNCEVLDGTKHK